MLYLFYAPSGTGKSALKTAMLEPFLRNALDVNMDSKGLLKFLELSPKKRLKLCHNRIDALSDKYEKAFDKPLHCVQSNETIWTKHRGKMIQSYDLPGDKIGLYDEFYETWCPPPFSIIGWDEAQREVAGRDSANMDPRVIMFLSLHRKWHLDVLCFTQRGSGLDLTIRDNCTIIEVAEMKHSYDKYGFIKSTTWKLHIFNKLQAMERSSATGNKIYKTTYFTFKGNIFKHFDSQEGEEYFEQLALKHGINCNIKERCLSAEEYVENNPYTPPVEYGKTSKDDRKKRSKEKIKNAKEGQSD